MFFYLFNFLFRIALAGGKPCPEPDFDLTNPGESMEFVKTRDQDEGGMCFAYSAAEAADAYRFSILKQDPKKFSVPIESALYYATSSDFRNGNNGNARESFLGGYNSDALLYYMNEGGCLSESRRDGILSSFGESQLEQCKNLEALFTLRQDALDSAKVNTKKVSNFSNCLNNKSFELLGISQKKFMTDMMDSVQIKERHHYDRLRISLRKQCTHYTPLREHSPSPTLVEYFNPDVQLKKKLLLQSLTAHSLLKKQPVLLSLCMNTFATDQKKNFYIPPQIKDTQGITRINMNQNKECVGHSVLATGIKTINDVCYIKVRDSYSTPRLSRLRIVKTSSDFDYFIKLDILKDALFGFSNLQGVSKCPPHAQCRK